MIVYRAEKSPDFTPQRDTTEELDDNKCQVSRPIATMHPLYISIYSCVCDRLNNFREVWNSTNWPTESLTRAKQNWWGLAIPIV